MTQLIALHGPAGVGKSYCGDIFVKRFGFTRVKFADPLKNMTRNLLHSAGITDPEMIEKHIEGEYKEVPCHAFAGHSPRHVMQTLGNEWGRQLIDPDFWVFIAMLKVRSLLAKNISVVIDDCRYVNEAKTVEDLGGRVIQIMRPLSKRVGNHVSEVPLPTAFVHGTLYNLSPYEAEQEVSRIVREGSKT